MQWCALLSDMLQDFTVMLWDRYAMLREMELKGLMIYVACITNTKSVCFFN